MMAGECDKCLGEFQTRMWIGGQVEETRDEHCICTDNLGGVFLFFSVLSFIVLCGVICYTRGLFTTCERHHIDSLCLQ